MFNRFIAVFILLATCLVAQNQITLDQAKEDFETVLKAIQEKEAYYPVSNLNIKSERQRFLKAIQQWPNNQGNLIHYRGFRFELQKTLAKLMNLHTSAGSYPKIVPSDQRYYLPFALEHYHNKNQEHYVALKDWHKQSFLNPDKPYLVSISGKLLTQYSNVIDTFVPYHSTWQYIRSNANMIEAQYFMDYLLKTNTLKKPSNFSYVLCEKPLFKNKDLKQNKPYKDLKRKIHKRIKKGQCKQYTSEYLNHKDYQKQTQHLNKPFEEPLCPESKIINTSKFDHLNNMSIGYLKLPSFLCRKKLNFQEHMNKLKNSDALIIDMRGNGGGWRFAMRDLFPYFFPEGQKSMVASYGLPRNFSTLDLSGRFMFSSTQHAWNETEHNAIESFLTNFKISPLILDRLRQFKLINKSDENARLYKEPYVQVASQQDFHFHYTKPVFILMGRNNFSAADAFLSAMAQLPQIKLIGQNTAGGSAASAGYGLKHTGLKISHAQMISLQLDGTIFEGRGVQADIVHDPIATDIVGKTDSLLEKTLQLLSK